MGSRSAIVALMLAVSSCQPQDIVVSSPGTPAAESRPGLENAASFLVAHHAALRGDVDEAARQYTAALTADPSNTKLLERSFRSLYLSGQIENAAAIASTLEQQGNPVNLGGEPIAAITARAGDWAGLEVVARHLNENITSRRLAIILEAWALAFQQQGDAGLSRLLDLADPENTAEPQPLMFSQTAAMMDYLGRGGDAIAAVRSTLDQPGLTVGTVLSMASILARNGRIGDAETVLRERLGASFAKGRIMADIRAGTSTLMIPPDTADLLVEAVIAAGQSDPSSPIGFLARLRFAAHIDPDHDLLRYHLGNQFRQIGNIEEGMAQYQAIRPESPWYQPTMLVTALHRSRVDDDFETASTLFRRMLEQNPDHADLWRYFGDAARRHGDHEQALSHYEQALVLGGSRARLQYKRGVTFDSLKRFDEAEAALRQSIQLDQSNAYALNYLGYWLLEHEGDPEEALRLIRAAVTAQPRNGYFMDSLGWGYYRLGRYDRAVQFLERAVMLRPADPIITDHLGDAYHKVGRLREAIFQWQRVLEAPGDELDPATIEAKIEATKAQLDP
ncbi:MAG: tetratricopeptide repeat protein [Candidatus Puniceispirillales bacterium]